MTVPNLPTSVADFIPYVAKRNQPIHETLVPFLDYEARLRELYAQEPDNEVLRRPLVNVVPIFAGCEDQLKIQARDLGAETSEERDRYVLPLPIHERKANGAPAVVSSLKHFKKNFSIFSESALADLDWNNVVAAGSSVVTSLLPVEAPHNESKRALREYYHEKLAPASDVDLFIYGLNEQEAIRKIDQIETKIRDSILYETTTIRTKNAITIASQYPTRHVQIVLRLYKDISEILTGFDVDCSCVAFDGSQVWASPRAIAAYMTQINRIDLSRRSPSYENRLSKYSHRGFEVHCPTLDRSRIDPTIFERAFGRVMGLARLLVLEKLPSPTDRDNYLRKRREERGRPQLFLNVRSRGSLRGNIKEQQPDDVAEWVEEDDVSNYHTFTIPYGPKYSAKKIERLLFTKDLLLNADWNRPKDREVSLHRHPAFFGSFQDVIGDCCGFCPEPKTEQEALAAVEESKVYIRGPIVFIQDNPGRQTIGSFNPITEGDWTEMAYVGNTEVLCQAIVDGDVDGVEDWCTQDGADVNRRDHVGRTPLQLAALCSSVEIVECLINHGARMISRLADGMTALHIAARRGQVAMVKAMLDRSEANAEEAEERLEAQRMRIRSGIISKSTDTDMDGDSDDSAEFLDEERIGSQDTMEITESSFVRLPMEDHWHTIPEDDDSLEPDVFDPNLTAWDIPVNPLHLAILEGHVDVVELLVYTYGADVLLPVKLINPYSNIPRAAILTLILAARFSPDSQRMVRKLLELGASIHQADMKEDSVLHHLVNDSNLEILDTLLRYDPAGARSALNHVAVDGSTHRPQIRTPLLTSIYKGNNDLALKLLEAGVDPAISRAEFIKAYQRKHANSSSDPDLLQRLFEGHWEQPIITAIGNDMPVVALKMVELGVDVNTSNSNGLKMLWKTGEMHAVNRWAEPKSILELVQERIDALQRALTYQYETQVESPPPLEHDSHYLQGLRDDTYQHWLAKGDLRVAKLTQEWMNSEREEELAVSKAPEKQSDGVIRKRQAMEAALKEHQRLATSLRDRGAKTFKEMHPELKVEELPPRANTVRPQVCKVIPYETQFKFLVPDCGPQTKKGYTKLFEATWLGNVDDVKALTLRPWLLDENGILQDTRGDPAQTHMPLKVAVQDNSGFSPFALAVVRGHLSLAQLIIEIATVQYEPENDETPRFKFSLQPLDGESDESDDLDEDSVRVYSELIDDQFTVEDVGALSQRVGSRVSPITMIRWPCQIWRLFDDFGEATKLIVKIPQYFKFATQFNPEGKMSWARFHRLFDHVLLGTASDLLHYAVAINNPTMLDFLLERGRDLMVRKEEKYAETVIYTVPDDVFVMAMMIGRTELMGHLIRWTGARMPLTNMMDRSGIKIQEKPRYYQGLSVYGKKRRDWAEIGRRTVSRAVVETETSPLLLAAFSGNLRSTEYFLGDAPMNRYLEFAQQYKHDKRIQALQQYPGGIEQVVTRWLEARSHLAVHASVLSHPTAEGSTKQLQYLLKALPDAVNGANRDGYSSLHIAFRYGRLAAAQLLINSGAEVRKRDFRGRNILHHYLDLMSDEKREPIIFKKFLSILDSNDVKELFLQRTSVSEDSQTPLSAYIYSNPSRHAADIIPIILSYTSGKDLKTMNAHGEYPLHYVVRQGWTRLARIVVTYNPSLLYWENAVGMTPLDIIKNEQIRQVNYVPQFPPPSHIVVSQSLDVRRPESFLPIPKHSQQQPQDDHDSKESTWHLCTQIAATLDPKHRRRRLVSLFDANEVTKRLAAIVPDHAASSNRATAAEVGVVADKDKDEVEDWTRRTSRENLELKRIIAAAKEGEGT